MAIAVLPRAIGADMGIRIGIRLRSLVLAMVLAIFVALLAGSLVPAPARAESEGFTPTWVNVTAGAHLWSGPDHQAFDYGPIPAGTSLLVVLPPDGPRLFVYVPSTQDYAWADAASIAAAKPEAAAAWSGKTVAELYVRAAPTRQSALLRVLPAGTPVEVVAWVEGDEVVPGDWTWARFADGTYGYTQPLVIVPPSSPPPPPSHPAGRWIDVNTLRQTVVAYEGDHPVYLAIASTGSPSWDTGIGAHTITRRVADEWMRGSTLNLSADRRARATYDIPHVRYTQYFTANGDALHENFWLPSNQFGIPHSHGCVGLRTADAAWFWNWASLGTPIIVHAG